MSDVRRLPVGEEDEGPVTLDDLAREGARRMIAAALEAEVDEYVGSFVGEVDEDGKRLVVRNGRARERRVTVGSGTVPVRAPRVNDKRVDEEGERKRFGSRILPAYARRSPKVTEVLPILYLHGLSTGDFRPALRDLLGEDASGLSSSSIQRLTEQWQAEHAAFATRELRFHRYAYLFVDGVNVAVRLGEDPKVCLLVVIGVREDGRKELLAVEDGYRESEDSWAVVFRDLRDRGMSEPKLVTGDGALGAWAALRNVFPATREQRCWVHYAEVRVMPTWVARCVGGGRVRPFGVGIIRASRGTRGACRVAGSGSDPDSRTRNGLTISALPSENEEHSLPRQTGLCRPQRPQTHAIAAPSRPPRHNPHLGIVHLMPTSA